MRTKKEKHYFKDRKKRTMKAKVRRKEDKYGLETPFMDTREKVFDNWLRQTHSDALAADYYCKHDPDHHDRRDPRHWPRRFTRNDQPLYRR